MKADNNTKINNKLFNYKENHNGINQNVKAVIANFGDNRGDIIVKNDNFGTRRKYADFTKGKQEVGLSPFQGVFSGIEMAHICGDRYINKDDEVCYF